MNRNATRREEAEIIIVSWELKVDFGEILLVSAAMLSVIGVVFLLSDRVADDEVMLEDKHPSISA